MDDCLDDTGATEPRLRTLLAPVAGGSEVCERDERKSQPLCLRRLVTASSQPLSWGAGRGGRRMQMCEEPTTPPTLSFSEEMLAAAGSPARAAEYLVGGGAVATAGASPSAGHLAARPAGRPASAKPIAGAGRGRSCNGFSSPTSALVVFGSSPARELSGEAASTLLERGAGQAAPRRVVGFRPAGVSSSAVPALPPPWPSPPGQQPPPQRQQHPDDLQIVPGPLSRGLKYYYKGAPEGRLLKDYIRVDRKHVLLYIITKPHAKRRLRSR